uniref:Proline-alanine-serine rich protein n=1 Tax=Beauveria bassiana polymycovirus 3 TaxID=1740648 RepID=A0A7R9NHH9_9VIRU|nr:proline-alanine-serine rich protein [Beauveria bassiana polymycovirus 3]
MSLHDVVSKDAAERLAELTLGDIDLVLKVASLGLSATNIHEGVLALSEGRDYEPPRKLGGPRAITINAWSFVSDRGQYHDTYGLTDGRAGELKTLLRGETDQGISEITSVVTAALQKKGSNRPVRVVRDGMPGISKTDGAPSPGKQSGADLKLEIAKHPQIYGMYKFDVEDTGRPGALRYKCHLGHSLYACFQNKRGAIDVARICRVNGRRHPAVDGRVYFWRDDKSPLAGSDIPEQCSFDGKLLPMEPTPPKVVSKAKTEAVKASGS